MYRYNSFKCKPFLILHNWITFMYRHLDQEFYYYYYQWWSNENDDFFSFLFLIPNVALWKRLGKGFQDIAYFFLENIHSVSLQLSFYLRSSGSCFGIARFARCPWCGRKIYFVVTKYWILVILRKSTKLILQA